MFGVSVRFILLNYLSSIRSLLTKWCIDMFPRPRIFALEMYAGLILVTKLIGNWMSHCPTYLCWWALYITENLVSPVHVLQLGYAAWSGWWFRNPSCKFRSQRFSIPKCRTGHCEIHPFDYNEPIVLIESQSIVQWSLLVQNFKDAWEHFHCT